MRIGGGTRTAYDWARCRVTQIARTPKAGLIVLAPLVLGAAVAASPGPATVGPAPRDTVLPLAAVAPNRQGQPGPSVVSVARPPVSFHIAEASIVAPPPPLAVVNSVGSLRIPAIALAAYRNAERMMALADPECGVSWNLLAGIGRIESMHANGGATDARGTAVYPIYGPALDGSLPGNEVIVQSMAANGRVTYARAIGPMQFLPGTWARFASDGAGDGKPDPQNIFDASLAAARYLCSGGLNLRDPSQVLAAILRYNNSMPYAQNVLGWAAAYATGVVPVDLPPITGPVPPVGDAHLEGNPEGLGPGLPLNVLGLSPTDPMAQVPLVTFGSTDTAAQLTNPIVDPAMLATQNPAQPPSCVLVCFGQNPLPSPAQFVPQGTGPLPGPAPAPSSVPTAVRATPSPEALPNPFAPPPNPFAPPQPPFAPLQPPFAPPQPPFAPPPPPFAPPPATGPYVASPAAPAAPVLPATHGPLPGPTN